MTRQYIDVHVVQTIPPSNINRDDTGSPKTAIYGGTRRARVSSQAWKRAARKDFENYLNESDLGVRSKRLVEILADAIGSIEPDSGVDDRVKKAEELIRAVGIKLTKARKGDLQESGYLVFLSNLQVEALARLGAKAIRQDEEIESKSARALVKEKNSIDLALFGRMVADVSDLNVDAAAQVAHAISVHAVDNEFDYFTAVDDHKAKDAKEDAGAGMIGSIEFNSSTLYRYATINVSQLQNNLGDITATQRAVEAFIRSFVISLPTGKQNTFANRTQPDAVIVTVRSDQPVNWIGAFETAITRDTGHVEMAITKLADYARDLDSAYGVSGRTNTWVVGVGSKADPLTALGERVTFDELVSKAAQTVGGDNEEPV